jgi:hypothetical protein
MMALGAAYLPIMLIGASILRRPPEGWAPAGWVPLAKSNKMITDRSVSRNAALGTVQFYLLWGILFINVTAGIGILAQASPMAQDMFRKTPLAAAGLAIGFVLTLLVRPLRHQEKKHKAAGELQQFHPGQVADH